MIVECERTCVLCNDQFLVDSRSTCLIPINSWLDPALLKHLDAFDDLNCIALMVCTATDNTFFNTFIQHFLKRR